MAGRSRSKFQNYVEVTPAIAAAAYTANDLVGEKISLVDAVLGGEDQTDKQGGLIQSVILTDLAKQSVSTDVIFFDTDPSNTTFTDDAEFDIDDADLINIVGVATVNDWKDYKLNSVGQVLNLAIPFVLETGSTLYAALVTRGAPTYVSVADLTLRVGVLSG